MTDLDQMLAADVRQRLRDRFERIATAALNGLVSCPNTRDTPDGFARSAVALAYALVAELDKEPQP